MTSKEALKRLYLNSYTIEELSVVHSDIKDYDLVFQDLDRLEKLEKAIEILKDKKPNLFKYFRDRQKYTEYFVNRELTEEEYELLKEVFGNDK